MEMTADAPRLIRARRGLTQTAASKLDGAPDFRTLSHWETRRKLPSLRLLTGYLEALGLDFHDLQDVLDQVGRVGATTGRLGELTGQVDRLARVCEDLERRLFMLERQEPAVAVAALTARLEAIEGLTGSVSALDARVLNLELNATTLEGLAALVLRVEEIERLTGRVDALERRE